MSIVAIVFRFAIQTSINDTVFLLIVIFYSYLCLTFIFPFLSSYILF